MQNAHHRNDAFLTSKIDHKLQLAHFIKFKRLGSCARCHENLKSFFNIKKSLESILKYYFLLYHRQSVNLEKSTNWTDHLFEINTLRTKLTQ
ncbi:hypothetical protein BpHYR1_048675 [Brachionus plicatilis]|uniref:Uncharacterized protein n=1 Tax=Brachionus plicatilis TaxID=10195 RepID=A0A3M7QMT3_BRAPC|nr:hypothetical protein BpHYR1_048675 [Brachionus plicatilis]